MDQHQTKIINHDDDHDQEQTKIINHDKDQDQHQNQPKIPSTAMTENQENVAMDQDRTRIFPKDMNAAKAVTGGNRTSSSSAFTGRNETPTPTSIGVAREMNMENAITETPTPASTEKNKEIQAEIEKKHKYIDECFCVLLVAAFRFRRNKEQLRVESSPQTDMQTDETSKVLKRKHDDQQGVEPITVKDSVETCALTGSIHKLDLQGKDMSDLQEETEKQKSDSGTTERQIKKAVRLMAALRGSTSQSDNDYAVFKRSLKGSRDDPYRNLLRQNGVLGSREATMEGGKKEINTDCVIQSLAKLKAKEMQQTFFGYNSVFDPSNDLDVLTIKVFKIMEDHTYGLYRLYIAEELEKNKMVKNGTDLSEA